MVSLVLSKKSEERAHSGWKRVTTQSFAATDIIRHSARQSAGVVKTILSQQMHVDGSSDHLFKIAGCFGICISKNWVREREYNKLMKASIPNLRVGSATSTQHIVQINIGK
jgi:hypothetical protein